MVDQMCSTEIPGLYAAGEVCGHGGMFGADRVAGAIAACQVLGHRAGKYAAFKALETKPSSISPECIKEEEKRWSALASPNGFPPREPYRKLQQVCLDQMGIIRNGKDLAAVWQKIEEIEDTPLEIGGMKDLVEAMEVKNLALTAKLVARAALERTESRGQHQREDYPSRNDREWLKWILLRKREGKILVDKKVLPLEKYRLRPDGVKN